MAGFPRVSSFGSSPVTSGCGVSPTRTSKKRGGALALGVGIVVWALHAPTTALAGGSAHAPLGPSTTRIHLLDLATAWRLRQAIDGAHEWLADPGCTAVFSDFEDLSGTRLSDVLAERGLTGQEQLDRLGFFDGSDLRQCDAPGAAFRTAPGYALVYVCPIGFRQVSTDTYEARAMVIHEVLHTLGLGENPPAPDEITHRVLERCGPTHAR